MKLSRKVDEGINLLYVVEDDVRLEDYDSALYALDQLMELLSGIVSEVEDLYEQQELEEHDE